MGGRDFFVFSKPWKDVSVSTLGGIVKRMGFDGVEFPLRDGYQVEPAGAEKGLPKLAGELGQCGVKICTVASETTERVFAGCQAAGVPIIRVMFMNYGMPKQYLQAESDWKREIEGFLPLCVKYGVKVSVQQHCGPGVNNSMEMLHLLEGYDAKLVGGVWDAAHSGLAGEEPEQALDIIWSHLHLANFKNACYIRANGPEAPAKYRIHMTTGENGLCSWERAVAHLKKRGYAGGVCMPAEYSDDANVEAYAARDLAYLKGLFENA